MNWKEVGRAIRRPNRVRPTGETNGGDQSVPTIQQVVSSIVMRFIGFPDTDGPSANALKQFVKESGN